MQGYRNGAIFNFKKKFLMDILILGGGGFLGFSGGRVRSGGEPRGAVGYARGDGRAIHPGGPRAGQCVPAGC